MMAVSYNYFIRIANECTAASANSQHTRSTTIRATPRAILSSMMRSIPTCHPAIQMHFQCFGTDSFVCRCATDLDQQYVNCKWLGAGSSQRSVVYKKWNKEENKWHHWARRRRRTVEKRPYISISIRVMHVDWLLGSRHYVLFNQRLVNSNVSFRFCSLSLFTLSSMLFVTAAVCCGSWIPTTLALFGSEKYIIRIRHAQSSSDREWVMCSYKFDSSFIKAMIVSEPFKSFQSFIHSLVRRRMERQLAE